MYLPVLEHLQEVLQTAQKQVVFPELGRAARTEHPGLLQPFERQHGVAARELRMLQQVLELQPLDQELEVADAAGSRLDVAALIEPALDLPGQRQIAQALDGGEGARAALRGIVPQAGERGARLPQQGVAERAVPPHRPQAQQGLHLPVVGRPGVVGGQRPERVRQFPGTAVGAQAPVYPVARHLAAVSRQRPAQGAGQRGDLLRQRRAPLGGQAAVVVQRQQVEVRAVVELLRPQLAERQDAHPRRQLRMPRRQLAHRGVDERLGDHRQLAHHVGDRGLQAVVPDGDAQQFAAPQRAQSRRPGRALIQLPHHLPQPPPAAQPLRLGHPVEQLRVAHQGVGQKLTGGEDADQQLEARRLAQQGAKVVSRRAERGDVAFPVVERPIRVRLPRQLVAGQYRQAGELHAVRRAPGEAREVARRRFRLGESQAAQHPLGAAVRAGLCAGLCAGRGRAQHQIGDAGNAARTQGTVAEMGVYEAPHPGAAGFQLQVQPLRRAQRRIPPIAHAPRQVPVLHRPRGRQVEVARRAAQDAQRVYQAAVEVVGLPHLLRFELRQDAGARQFVERLVHAGGAQRGPGRAVADLQHLHRVLHVHQGAGAELGIQPAAGIVFGYLAPAHPVNLLQRYGAGLVDQFVAQALQARAQLTVARHGAQPDERQPLVGQRFASGAVVAGEALQAHRARPRGAVGPQAQIDLEDAGSLGADAADGRLRQPLEVFPVFDPLRAGGGTLVAVHEHQLDVGGVPQGAAAELAEPHHRQAGIDAAQSTRDAELRAQRRRGQLQRGADHALRQPG